jgi:hypothetical protein
MKMRTYLFAAAAVVLAGLAAWGVTTYSTSDNSAPKLWATDGTVMHTVAASSDDDGPTREHPVYIIAQVERLYGLHIGTPVKVRYIIKSQNSVKVRFDTLMRGIISRWKSTWRLVDKPVVVSVVRDGGFTTRTIDVVVAVWEPPVMPELAPGKLGPEPAVPPLATPDQTTLAVDRKAPSTVAVSPEGAAAAEADAGNQPADAQAAPAPQAPPGKAELWPFTVEFLVSTDKLASGSDKWDYIETPPVKFGFASLVEPDAKELDIGPMGIVPDSLNPVGIGLIAAGAVTVLGGIVYLCVLCFGWLRVRRTPVPVPEVVIEYRGAMAQAEKARQLRSHLEQFRVAVRDFLGGATLPDAALLHLWQEHPLHEQIADALSIMRQAAANERLTSYEEQRVRRLVEQLIQMRLADDAAALAAAKGPSLWARTRALSAAGWGKVRSVFKWRRT